MTELSPNEQIIYRSKPHWVHLFFPGIMVIIGLCCTATTLTGYFAETQKQAATDLRPVQMFISCSTCLLGLALLFTILAIITYITTSLTLTNKRVIVERGLLRRQSKEIFLHKVESVSVDTPLAGRMLGYGTIIITGSGGASEYFSRIANPQQIRQHIQNQLEQARHSLNYGSRL